MKTKTLLVSILGVPNAGKSTLLNRLVGQKISIVTPKVQTTRTTITGILTCQSTQLAFLDTPGIFAPKRNLEKVMVRYAWSSIVGTDLALLLIDASKKLDKQVEIIITRLLSQNINFFIVFNKIDKAGPKSSETKQYIKNIKGISENQIFDISALNGENVANLLDKMISIAPNKPWLYDEDDITTASIRFIAQEITRETLFLELRQELPYNIKVETEKWQNISENEVKIHQVIVINKANYKATILGKGGSKIKIIGQNSRLKIEQNLGLKVHLFLFVKTSIDWDKKPTPLN